jgi:hypothetical protein
MAHMTHNPVIDAHARTRKRMNSANVSGLSYTSLTAPLKGMALQDPTMWIPEFEVWALRECIFRDRCFGGLGALHRAFSDWCLRNHSVPCRRDTFEQLLERHGFMICELLAYGLLLREDGKGKPLPPNSHGSKPAQRVEG